jgi:hypothetical protein
MFIISISETTSSFFRWNLSNSLSEKNNDNSHGISCVRQLSEELSELIIRKRFLERGYYAAIMNQQYRKIELSKSYSRRSKKIRITMRSKSRKISWVQPRMRLGIRRRRACTILSIKFSHSPPNFNRLSQNAGRGWLEEWWYSLTDLILLDICEGGSLCERAGALSFGSEVLATERHQKDCDGVVAWTHGHVLNIGDCRPWRHALDLPMNRS